MVKTCCWRWWLLFTAFKNLLLVKHSYMLQNRWCVWEIGDKCANNRIKQGPGCIWRRGWSTREGRPLQGITGTQARSSRSGVAQLFYRCHRHRHHRQHDHHPAFIGRALVFLSHGFSEHLGLYHEVGTFLSELIFNRPKVGWWVGGFKMIISNVILPTLTIIIIIAILRWWGLFGFWSRPCRPREQ